MDFRGWVPRFFIELPNNTKPFIQSFILHIATVVVDVPDVSDPRSHRLRPAAAAFGGGALGLSCPRAGGALCGRAVSSAKGGSVVVAEQGWILDVRLRVNVGILCHIKYARHGVF